MASASVNFNEKVAFQFVDPVREAVYQAHLREMDLKQRPQDRTELRIPTDQGQRFIPDEGIEWIPSSNSNTWNNSSSCSPVLCQSCAQVDHATRISFEEGEEKQVVSAK